MTRARQGRALTLVGAGVLAVVLAACGGSETSDGDSNDVDATTTTTRPDTATTTTTIGNSGSDFVAPELGNTSWNVTRYQLPSGGMTNLWPGTEIDVTFSTDGTVSGFSGCNTYTGTYAVEGSYNEDSGIFGTEQKGQAIEMGPFAVTEIGCADNTMEQEGEYLDDLLSARFWLLNDSGNFILHGSDGFFLVQGEPIT